MEEILSSIRRIIADEEAEDGKQDLAAADDQVDDEDEDDEDDEDVLELTKVVQDGGEVVDLQGAPAVADDPDQAAADAAADDVDEPSADVDDDLERAAEAAGAMPDEVGPAAASSLEDVEEEIEITSATPAPEPVAQESRAVPSSSAATQNLISDSAATVATGAFARLSKAYQRTPDEVSVADASGRSIEQFIEDMIRPMLKDWLDENMPPLVERLVEKEIQKLARRSELI